MKFTTEKKLTDLQKKYLDRINSGWRYWVHNAHHSSGGTMYWIYPDGQKSWELCRYRVIQNLCWKVNEKFFEILKSI